MSLSSPARSCLTETLDTFEPFTSSSLSSSMELSTRETRIIELKKNTIHRDAISLSHTRTKCNRMESICLAPYRRSPCAITGIRLISTSREENKKD
jgi:hypothetical protein